MINRETIDLRYVEQITDSEQVTALGYCVRYAQKHHPGREEGPAPGGRRAGAGHGEGNALRALREQFQYCLHGEAEEPGDLCLL